MTALASICLCLASFSLYLPRFYHFSFRIKSKISKSSKARKPKLAGRIVELAKKDIHAASMLAQRGREFTEIETLVDLYCQVLQKSDDIKSGKKTAEEKILEDKPCWTEKFRADFYSYAHKSVDEFSNQLSRVFLTAIKAGDSEKIFEIGRAVEFLKVFKPQRDQYRMVILFLKTVYEKSGDKWPIRSIAKLIGWPDTSGADGFKTVRRMCEELNCPIADSRKKANKPKSNG